MSVLGQWWEYLIGMVRDTGRVFARLLPLLLATYLLGWIGYQICMTLAAKVADWNAYAALGIMSVGFVSILSATIACLRLVGNDLGIKDDLPEGAVDDDREQSFANLLAITLLPFLGIYAVFDYITDAARELEIQIYILNGAFSETVATDLNPVRSKRQLVITIGVLVAAYVLRRTADLLHERTNIRPFGLLAAFLEGFFMLVLLLSGTRLVRSWSLWLRDRQFQAWLDAVTAGASQTLSVFKVDFPAFIDWWGVFLRDELWPSLMESWFEPVLWLAVAALVYGSNVLSLADMWRKGQPVASALPAQMTSRISQHIERSKLGAGKGRRVWLEVQEAFFGDVDDKYLPTLQSLRLMLRAGLTFIAAYLLLYTIITLAERWIMRYIHLAIGGRPDDFWVGATTVVDMATTALTEPLRLCLLAVAFHTALRAFKAKAAGVPDGHEMDETPDVAEGSGTNTEISGAVVSVTNDTTAPEGSRA